MGESEVIGRTAAPLTVTSLVDDLRALGLAPGAVVVMHSSLSALGWVVGGPEAVVEAVRTVLAEDGTLVVPTFSTARSDPSHWANPPVPEAWWPVIRDEMPGFDPRVASTRDMGSVVECVLRWPGTVRGPHPHYSFAALGPRATEVVAPHPWDAGLGDGSPLGRLYELDAHVLLLGVGHANNSSLHLAEARADFPGKHCREEGASVLVEGARRWVTYQALVTDADDFPAVGAAFESSGTVRVGAVGAGEARLMRQRDLVDFGVDELTRRRGQGRT